MNRLFTLIALLAFTSAAETFHEVALSRANDLKLSSYMTSGTVANLFNDDPEGAKAVALLRSMGITTVYVEVYRGGHVVPKTELIRVRDLLQENGFTVIAGIATVPGGDFGVRQDAPLGWFNWENEKTQRDLLPVIQTAAEVFDAFIVDDFLCTGDISAESDAAKGDRGWGEYRRDLLSKRSQDLFVNPAKAINPDITMIIKYPQWYDLYHRFGYDVVREPQIFDQVFVGTESRGARTQRFGFTQPYEGYVAYRWMNDLAGDKMAGAWFDHGDCDGLDFVEQAYQTVLAGAREIVLFSYAAFQSGHDGHELLRQAFPALADLAAQVAKQPASGVWAYKPPNSEPAGDLYLYEHLGMLGIPVNPTPTWRDDDSPIFLATQATADPDAVAHALEALEAGRRIIVTTGFLATAARGEVLAERAGIDYSFEISPAAYPKVSMADFRGNVPRNIDVASSDLKVTTGASLIVASEDQHEVPYLVKAPRGGDALYVLNSHTYSQDDFDRVGEVLLAPRELGLLDVPRPVANQLREAFLGPNGIDSPSRVSAHFLANNQAVYYNYNFADVTVQHPGLDDEILDGFTKKTLTLSHDGTRVVIPARTGVWIQP